MRVGDLFAKPIHRDRFGGRGWDNGMASDVTLTLNTAFDVWDKVHGRLGKLEEPFTEASLVD